MSKALFRFTAITCTLMFAYSLPTQARFSLADAVHTAAETAAYSALTGGLAPYGGGMGSPGGYGNGAFGGLPWGQWGSNTSFGGGGFGGGLAGGMASGGYGGGGYGGGGYGAGGAGGARTSGGRSEY